MTTIPTSTEEEVVIPEEIVEEALPVVEVEPAQAFYVDDNQTNVEAAEQICLNGIVFKNSEQLKDDLKQLGVLIDGPSAA